ncbi:MAG: hypothetical protein ACM31L_04600 [Actinomycetota bacterium]
MDALTGAPAHVLLNNKDRASHSIIKPRTGAGGSAFASFSYGPLDLPDAKNKAGVEGSKSATGSKPASSPLQSGNIGWLTQLAASSHQK